MKTLIRLVTILALTVATLSPAIAGDNRGCSRGRNYYRPAYNGAYYGGGYYNRGCGNQDAHQLLSLALQIFTAVQVSRPNYAAPSSGYYAPRQSFYAPQQNFYAEPSYYAPRPAANYYAPAPTSFRPFPATYRSLDGRGGY